MPDDPRLPKSPDSLEKDGLHGRIPGVTRIGPRAFGVGFFVVLLLLLVILYGVLRKPGGGDQTSAVPTGAPIALQTSEGHFNDTVPIVPTAAAVTPPPPIVLPPSPVPNVDNTPGSAAAPVPETPATQSAEDLALAQQRAKEEQDRLAAQKAREEAYQAALHSKILTGQGPGQTANGTGASDASPAQLAYAGNGGDESGTGSSGVGGPGGTSNALLGRNASYAEPTPDPNAFLSGPTDQYKRPQAANVALPLGGNPKDFLQAQRFNPISPFQIMAGSVLPAETITGIDSDIPGFVTAQLREDVFDTKTGRYLLIPKGSKLVGLYKSGVSYGQARIQIAWTRLIFPDTTSIDLQDMSGSDTEGFAGFGGQVDNHFGKIIGAALLTSVLAAGLQLSQPQQTSVFSGVTPGQAVSQAVGQQITSVGTNLISKDLNIPPTITVVRGYPFLVIVDRDIVLPGPYGRGE